MSDLNRRIGHPQDNPVHQEAMASMRSSEAEKDTRGRCTCQKTPEGMLGWDRSMVDRGCPQHGHEAPPEQPLDSTVLAAEGDPLCVCQDTGARAIKGACPEHHGDACLINLPGYCIRATEDREARFRAEAALAEALDVIEAVVAGIVTLDGARVVLRKHGRLP